MQLIDIENEIKAMVAEDVNNPEIYKKVYDLVYFYLKRRHLLSYEQDYEEVAHIGATDLYLKAYNGNPVYSWIGYISVAYKAYIRQYRRLYRSEIIDTTNNPDLADAISKMSSASYIQNYVGYDNVSILNYIDSIEKTVDRILDDSKYMEYTSEYYNAKLSILISLANNKFITYGVKPEHITYVHMLYVYVKDAIINGIGNGTYNEGETLMQFTLENRQINSDKGE